MLAKPILVAQHEAECPPGTVLEALAEFGLTADVRKPYAGVALPNPQTIDEFAGFVVLGGSMNVDEDDRFPFLAEERRILAEALRRDVPTLGICLGAQLLATTIGGQVFDREEPEIGWLPIDIVTPGDPLLAGVENPFCALQWRSQGFFVPDEAVVLAKRPGDVRSAQAFLVGERAWGVQFHPEIVAATLQKWIAWDNHDVGRRRPELLTGLLERIEVVTTESRRLCRTLVRNWVGVF